jgi:hypothetical protein
MQTRRTNLDHHHQEGLLSTGPAGLSPEAELIALARGKGQLLTEHTLRLIRDTLVLRGVTLARFVADVRPHFRNAIHNPSGFLINFARNFGALSRPAIALLALPRSTPLMQPDAARCENCKGERLVIHDKQIEPCPKCSTQEFRREWQQREAEREQRARALRSESLQRVPLK